jgi:hypothetical protein
MKFFYFKIKLRKLCSTFIIAENADIETASDFIVAILQSDDRKIISSVLVQESVSDKFKTLLISKVKGQTKIAEVSELSAKGFEVIGDRIVLCPRSIISDSQTPIISYEIFRTAKEGVALAKTAASISLWSQNISVAFEFIHALNAAVQIWVNSSFGAINGKTPFLSNGNEVVCDQKLDTQSAIIEVAGNIQFQTSFQNEKFKTVVIPFGETFAN